MDGLEAQYGGYFIKNIKKISLFFEKKCSKLASFENILIFAT